MVQLQTEDWPDLTAPEEPRYLHDVTMSCIAIRLLLDLVHKTNDLQEVNRQSGQKAGDKIFLAVLLLFYHQARFWCTAAPEWEGPEPSWRCTSSGSTTSTPT